jgi:hypothetical protein
MTGCYWWSLYRYKIMQIVFKMDITGFSLKQINGNGLSMLIKHHVTKSMVKWRCSSTQIPNTGVS